MNFSQLRAGSCTLILLLVATVPAFATVVDIAANGFTGQVAAHIAAPPTKVYAALIKPAHWWDAEHTFSGSAANLTLEAKAGGCWCEKLADGGSAVHMTVVHVEPGKGLTLRGALGPFQNYAV